MRCVCCVYLIGIVCYVNTYVINIIYSFRCWDSSVVSSFSSFFSSSIPFFLNWWCDFLGVESWVVTESLNSDVWNRHFLAYFLSGSKWTNSDVWNHIFRRLNLGIEIFPEQYSDVWILRFRRLNEGFRAFPEPRPKMAKRISETIERANGDD